MSILHGNFIIYRTNNIKYSNCYNLTDFELKKFIQPQSSLKIRKKSSGQK